MAKMICVSFYFGHINRAAFQKKFGVALEQQFPDEVKFVKERGLMELQGEVLQLTKAGKDVINGVIPLFYSERSRQNLLNYRREDHVRLRQHSVHG
jgi:oxygen-independent coproporphyrinogen-3 oxidase